MRQCCLFVIILLSMVGSVAQICDGSYTVRTISVSGVVATHKLFISR